MADGPTVAVGIRDDAALPLVVLYHLPLQLRLHVLVLPKRHPKPDLTIRSPIHKDSRQQLNQCRQNDGFTLAGVMACVLSDVTVALTHRLLPTGSRIATFVSPVLVPRPRDHRLVRHQLPIPLDRRLVVGDECERQSRNVRSSTVVVQIPRHHTLMRRP